MGLMPLPVISGTMLLAWSKVIRAMASGFAAMTLSTWLLNWESPSLKSSSATTWPPAASNADFTFFARPVP